MKKNNRIRNLLRSLFFAKIFAVALYATVVFGMVRRVPSQWIEILLGMGLFGILWVLPYILFYCQLNIEAEGLRYKRFLRERCLPWESVNSVRNLYWFPWETVVVRAKGSSSSPLLYIWSDESRLQRVPNGSFWQLEGTRALTIKSKLLEWQKSNSQAGR